MSKSRPTTNASALQIDGVNLQRVVHLEPLLTAIRNYCVTENVTTDVESEKKRADTQKTPNLFPELSKLSKELPTQVREVYDYIKVGMTIASIRRETGRNDANIAAFVAKARVGIVSQKKSQNFIIFESR